MTSLRLDDRSESLLMAVREEKTEPWLHYSLQELRQLESKLGRMDREADQDEEDDYV